MAGTGSHTRCAHQRPGRLWPGCPPWAPGGGRRGWPLERAHRHRAALRYAPHGWCGRVPRRVVVSVHISGVLGRVGFPGSRPVPQYPQAFETDASIFLSKENQPKKTDLLQPPLSFQEWVIGGAGAGAGAPLVAEMIDREADRHVEVVVVVAEAAVTAARSEESPPAGMSAVSVSSSLTTAAKTSSATSRILLTETPSPRVPRCGSERSSTIARARTAPRT